MICLPGSEISRLCDLLTACCPASGSSITISHRAEGHFFVTGLLILYGYLSQSWGILFRAVHFVDGRAELPEGPAGKRFLRAKGLCQLLVRTP
jgi:hypothetical protein